MLSTYLQELGADCLQVKNTVAAAYAFAAKQGARLSYLYIWQAAKICEKSIRNFYGVHDII